MYKIFVSNRVVLNEGRNVGIIASASLMDCKKACDEDPICNSFAKCDPTRGNCFFYDKKLSGTEDTKHHPYCTTYYNDCGKFAMQKAYQYLPLYDSLYK